MFKGNMPFNSDYFYKNKCKIANETSQFLLQQHKTLTKKKVFILGKEMLKRNILNHQILETNHKELPHIIPTLLNFSC